MPTRADHCGDTGSSLTADQRPASTTHPRSASEGSTRARGRGSARSPSGRLRASFVVAVVMGNQMYTERYALQWGRNFPSRPSGTTVFARRFRAVYAGGIATRSTARVEPDLAAHPLSAASSAHTSSPWSSGHVATAADAAAVVQRTSTPARRSSPGRAARGPSPSPCRGRDSSRTPHPAVWCGPCDPARGCSGGRVPRVDALGWPGPRRSPRSARREARTSPRRSAMRGPRGAAPRRSGPLRVDAAAGATAVVALHAALRRAPAGPGPTAHSASCVSAPSAARRTPQTSQCGNGV